MQACQGLSDLQPAVGQSHPAANHLDQYQWCGISFHTKASYWTAEHKLQAVKQGSNKSATDYAKFVHEEFVNMAHKQFWVVSPVETVLHLKELCLSPVGVVPQHKH